MKITTKQKADGYCGVCGNRVPENNFNLFYCNMLCCDKAYDYFHPEKQDPDEYDGWYVDDRLDS